MRIVVDVVGVEALRKSYLGGGRFKFSTAFSGMGTMEKAVEMAKHEAAVLGLNMEPICTAACDKARICQTVLQDKFLSAEASPV